MKRTYSGLTVAGTLALMALAVGCSGTPTSQSSPTATGVTEANSQTPRPSDSTGRYGLMPGSRVNVESTQMSWPASSGELEVTTLENGDLRLTAQAVAVNSADRPWALDLTITNVGRSVTGTLTNDGVIWRVQPHTGVISTVKKGDVVTFATARAVTVSQRGVHIPGPMTFILTGRTSTG